MADILRFVTQDARWRILLKDGYKESPLEYFYEELWDQGEHMEWLSIHEKDEANSLLRMMKPGYGDTEIDMHYNNMVAKYHSLPGRPDHISEDIPSDQLRLFLYPVYGPLFEKTLNQKKSNNTKNLSLTQENLDGGEVIGYVLIGVSASDIAQKLNNIFHKHAYITFSLLLAGIAVVIFITRYLEKNITEFIQATRKITEEGFEQKVDIKPSYKELGELENAFNTMAEDIKEIDRLKETFLINMSHELRAPLHSIIGLSGALCKKNTNHEKEQYIKALSIINAEGNQLLNQINPILDLAKTRAGKMEIQYEEVNLNTLLQEVSFATRGLILSSKKPITLYSELLTKNIVINTDKEKLRNILHNLLSNAVKFTEEGRIEFSIWAEDEMIVFKVRDTGIGIDTKDKMRVFQRFQQVDNSLVQKADGIGIGMSLSKEYVDLLKGKIWLESKFGKGTAFYFKIPRKPVVQETERSNRSRFFIRLGLGKRKYPLIWNNGV